MQIRKIVSYFDKVKHDLLSQFEEKDKEEQVIKENLEEINFYIEKILMTEEKYEGEYSLEEVKAKYKDIVKNRVEEAKRAKQEEGKEL